MATELNRKENQGSDAPNVQRPRRRTRVAIACMRCKARRQRCDNQMPACFNCSRANLICTFADNEYPLHYVKGLESRVAQLEEQLSNISPSESMDHLVAPHNPEGTENPSSAVNKTSKFVNGVEFLSLCATAEPPYFGEGSGVSLVQLVDAVVYAKIRDAGPADALPLLEDKPFSCHSPKEGTPKAPLPPLDHGARFLDAYFSRIHVTYPFLSREHLWSIHQNRHYLENESNHEARLDWILVQLVYAIGSRCLQLVGSLQAPAISPEQLYVSALARIDDSFSRTPSIRNIQILILVAIYAMRSPSGASTWQLCGIMIRQCLELGLQRNLKVHPGQEYNNQLGKRLFWSVYLLERKVATVLGRPFGIHEDEIEADIPLEIDDGLQDEEMLAQGRREFTISVKDNQKWWPSRTSNLSFHICLTMLEQINSKFRLTLHQIRRGTSPEKADKKLSKRFNELETWRQNILSVHTAAGTPTLDGFDERQRLGLHLSYYQSKRMFLQSLITETKKRQQRTDYEACAEASGQICRLYRRIHRLFSTPFSLLDLHSVFVAGFTTVYCVWIDPTLYTADIAADFGACSTVLYIIAEQWTSAKRYRDAFEFVVGKTEAYVSNFPTRPNRQRQNVQQWSSLLQKGEEIAPAGENVTANTSLDGGVLTQPQPADWAQGTLFRNGMDEMMDVWQTMQETEGDMPAMNSEFDAIDYSGISELLTDEGLGWFCGLSY